MTATGVSAVDAAVVWSMAAAALAGGAALAWRMVRSVRRVVRLVEDITDDWAGTPERPGVAARPGVMERLEDIERGLAEVRHEVRPNGGASMRDALDRVDERTARIAPDE